ARILHRRAPARPHSARRSTTQAAAVYRLMGVRMDRKLSALLALVILLACPLRTTAQDVDRDGIPDALEAELAQRFVPLLRSYQLSAYYEIGFGFPKLIYRA